MNTLKLSNPNATKETVMIFDYLCSTYKKGILAGQQEDPRMLSHENEIRYVKAYTGKYPAIRGLDYIHNDFSGVNKRSIAWWKKGGIVTICWHWGIPPHGIGYPSSQETIDIGEALTEGTALHKGMLDRMDEVANALKLLMKEGVPVLWRPFHEFDGAWFWWGKGGGEQFIDLWKLMYDRFTNYHGLNNLIWVLGYSGDVKSGWYPGDEYVDIIGADTYSEGPQIKMFEKVKALSGVERPICYHENGPIPNPDDLIKNNIYWSWFMTWHTIHIMEQNSPEYVKSIYNHEYVITLDKLPDWKQKINE
jgi:mannan endo-1,4-beta-mannosidase